MKSRKNTSVLIALLPVAITAIALTLAFTVHAASTPSLAGDWQGAIETPNGALHVVLHISPSSDAKLTATLDSPDQGVSGIEVDTISFKESALHFEIARFSCSYDGNLDTNGLTIAGEWKQGTAALSLKFTRASKAPH
jgi:hypothetical protein